MSREIKFKVWYEDEKQMIIPEIIKVSSIGKDGGVWLECVDMVDRHGAWIFEGDWCRARFRKNKEGLIYIQGPVYMDDFMWCLESRGSEMTGEIFSINRLFDFEILGNIYETPEYASKPKTNEQI
jgi:hypothetical protein